jgi:hypothetical protein
MDFYINETSCCSVTIREEWSIFRGKEKLTDDELVKVLMGQDRCSSIKSDDHPEFKALREKLGAEGYIKIQRNWWNGDFVTKDFTLNGVKFCKGDQFLSGSAILHDIQYRKLDKK